MSRSWVMLVLFSIGLSWLTGCDSDSPGETPAPACVEDKCGVCDDDPANDCIQDCAGVWGGTTVECPDPECDAGFFGTDCTGECAGGSATPCSGHGECDDGSLGDGSCTCSSGWGGADCSIEGARVVSQLTPEENDFNSKNARLAAGGGGALYLVWQDCTGADTTCDKVSVMGSRHDGSEWGPAVNISPEADGSAFGEVPDVAVDSSGVAHIVWMDSGTVGSNIRAADENVIYRTWDGTTLGATSVVSVGGPMDCSSDCRTLYNAKIVLSGDNPLVVFSGKGAAGEDRTEEIYYSTYGDGAWMTSQLSDGLLDTLDTAIRGGRDMDVASDVAGNIHVIWVNRLDDGNGSIHSTSIIDGVVGTITKIPTACESTSVDRPSIAVDAAGGIHATWEAQRDCEDSDAGKGLFYSAAGGPPVDLTADAMFSGTSNMGSTVLATPLGTVITWSSSADVNGAGIDFDILSQGFNLDGTPVADVGIGAASEVAPGVSTSSGTSINPTSAIGGMSLYTCWDETEGGDGADFDVLCIVDTP